MNSNANSHNGNAAPVWPSMDSIMPPNAGASDAPPVQSSPTPQPQNSNQTQQPAHIEDTRLPGAPPLPVAGPTPHPNAISSMMNGLNGSSGRPGERAAAMAAKAEKAAAQQPKNEIASNGTNGNHDTNGAESAGEEYHLRSGEENLVAMPDLNKVKLPHSTGVVEKATESARQAAQAAKPVKSVEPEVARPLSSEPEVSAARMESSKIEASEPEPQVSPEPVVEEDSFTDTAQLALRVIFGFEGELSRQEVLDLAKDLEGIREVKLVGGPEAAAMKVLRDSAEEFEFAGESGLILRSDGYPVEFVGDTKVCLCVILEQPELPKGTLEKLTLIAREAARLG